MAAKMTQNVSMKKTKSGSYVQHTKQSHLPSVEHCKYIFLCDYQQNKWHQEHKDFSSKEEHILFFHFEIQMESHISGCWHNPDELCILPQHKILEGFLEDPQDNSRQTDEILPCKEHCFHKWCLDMDLHTPWKHKPYPGDSHYPLHIHLEMENKRKI